jgi:hypothetical protein
MLSNQEIRERAVELALQAVGIGANPKIPERRALYLQLIAANEITDRQHEMASMSGCALTCIGNLKKLGIKHPIIDKPYINSTAVTRLVGLAHRVGAWVNFAPYTWPSAGDMPLVGDNTPENGVEHVYQTITKPDFYDDPIVIESVDGGQRENDGNADYKKWPQLIEKKKRVWKGDRDIVFEGTDPGANHKAGRKIYGWVDIVRLYLACGSEY